MKKTITIKNSGIFSKTIYKGKSYSDKLLVVYILPNNQNINRIGISVGKKTGNSVERNRIKRLIREGYRVMENNLKKGFDIIFIPRKPSISKEIKLKDVSNSLYKIFKKLDILEEKI